MPLPLASARLAVELLAQEQLATLAIISPPVWLVLRVISIQSSTAHARPALRKAALRLIASLVSMPTESNAECAVRAP